MKNKLQGWVYRHIEVVTWTEPGMLAPTFLVRFFGHTVGKFHYDVLAERWLPAGEVAK